MNLCPNHDRELVLGFCDVFVKRAAIGHVGMGTEPTPIQYWHRRFRSFPELEQVKIASFAKVVAPALFKRAAPWWVNLGRAAGSSVDDIARGTAAAASSADDIARGAAGGARMVDFGGAVDDIPLGAATRAVPPTTSIPTGSPVTPTTGFAPLPADDVAAAYSRAAPGVGRSPTTLPTPPPPPAGANLPGWASRALTAYKDMPGWGRALTVGGLVYPTYQLAQGQIGPAEFGARVVGDVATMGRGFVPQVLGGWVAPMVVGKAVDPMLGWKPQEQRLMEAQQAGMQAGQQQTLDAVQQQLANQPAPPPQFASGPLTVAGPYGPQMRTELTMPFQMMQRQAIEKQYPGLR